jgi:hypothetical protein
MTNRGTRLPERRGSAAKMQKTNRSCSYRGSSSTSSTTSSRPCPNSLRRLLSLPPFLRAALTSQSPPVCRLAKVKKRIFGPIHFMLC